MTTTITELIYSERQRNEYMDIPSYIVSVNYIIFSETVLNFSLEQLRKEIFCRITNNSKYNETLIIGHLIIHQFLCNSDIILPLSFS